MGDPREMTTAEFRARALEILGGDPADRTLWDANFLEIFGLVTSTREPRHQRPTDRWDAEVKKGYVLRTFDHALTEPEPHHWPLEFRVLLSLRTAMRYEL